MITFKKYIMLKENDSGVTAAEWVASGMAPMNTSTASPKTNPTVKTNPNEVTAEEWIASGAAALMGISDATQNEIDVLLNNTYNNAEKNPNSEDAGIIKSLDAIENTLNSAAKTNQFFPDKVLKDDISKKIGEVTPKINKGQGDLNPKLINYYIYKIVDGDYVKGTVGDSLRTFVVQQRKFNPSSYYTTANQISKSIPRKNPVSSAPNKNLVSSTVDNANVKRGSISMSGRTY